MISLWRRLITPQATNPALRRREALLYRLTLTGLGAALLWLLVSLVAIVSMGTHPRLRGDIVLGLEGLAFATSAYLVARRGYVRVGSYVALAGLLTMQISSMLLIWRMPIDPTLVFYALVIALAGLLLGRRGAVIFYLSSLFAYLATAAWLYHNGLCSAEITHFNTLPLIAIMLALVLGILLLVIHFYIRSLEQALEQAEELVIERTAQLARQSQQREAILHSIADGVVVVDQQGHLLMFNQVAHEILPCLQEQALGRPLGELGQHFEPDDPRGEVIRRMDQLASTPEALSTSLPHSSQRFSVGSQTWVSLYAPVIHDEGTTEGIVTILHNITREIEAIEVRTQFVSTVAHELRTPLTSVQGYSELLMADVGDKLSKEEGTYLSVIRRNIDRMESLVNDLLDLCRLESGQVQVEIGPTSLHTAIKEIVTIMRPQIEERRLSLNLALSADVPLILADPHRLNQILTNLLSNACRYTPPGGKIAIRTRMLDLSQQKPRARPDRERSYVEVAVADTGIGIPPKDQERIFDRFVRLDHPLVQRRGGTGLGLTIVRQLVRLQQGRIWVESTVGEGSTFTFTLPVAE